MNAFTELRNLLTKALRPEQRRFPSRSSILGLDRQPLDAGARTAEWEVGDATGSDVVMTPIRWIQASALEAPCLALDSDGNPAEGSAAQELLDNPNPAYGFDVLMSGTILDLCRDGNSYWLPVENGNGRWSELWWAPMESMEPKWPSNPTPEEMASPEALAFISHYEYTVNGEKMELAPESVIHFRQGVDPRNIRKGLSSLRGLLREIWTDNEAAAFTAGLLRRGAVPGLVVSPKPPQGDNEYELDPGQIKAAKASLEQHTRQGRGGVLGLTGPVDVQQFGFSPQQMDLSALRNIPEERVTAALGVAAAVVGFGTGLETTKVGATMESMASQSYRRGVVPLWKIIEGTLTKQMVPALQNGAASVRFDLSQVEALQEDADSLSRRIEREVRASIRKVGEGREALGLESGPEYDYFLVPMSTVAVPAGQGAQPVIDVTPEQRRLAGAFMKHTPTGIEREVIERAPRADPPQQVLAYSRAMERAQRQATATMEGDVTRAFQKLGRAAGRETRDLLREERAGAPAEVKQFDTLAAALLESAENQAAADWFVELIMEALTDDLTIASADLQLAFDATYRTMGQAAEGALSRGLGIEFILSDGAQVNILREGGTRLGLIDLDEQTRDALYKALADAREEGLAGDNLARKIREHVEAGPWRDVETRARVIARTEGAHAANTATLESARAMDDTNHVMVLDNRSGFDDEGCSAINGTVVTIAEAEAMGLCHPNGTRSYTPVNGLLLEEMGVEV